MKKILSSILLLTLTFLQLSGEELVIINGQERKTCGFLAKDKGKTYLYTSQSAIFGMKLIGVKYSFNAVTLNGKKVKTKGFMEISPDRDVARIKVEGDFPDAFKLGKINNIGEEITFFPEFLNSKSNLQQFSKVTGIGIYNFTFALKLENNVPGSPVLDQEGKVIGVLSGWEQRIEKGNPPEPKVPEPQKSKKKSQKKSKPKKQKGEANKPPPPPTFKKPFQYFKCVTLRKSLAARITPDMDWVSIDEVDFLTAGDALYEAFTLQNEFLPLLNWWYENPYRLVGKEIPYPKDVRKFVKYNNERAKRMHIYLEKMKADPKANENMLRGVRDNCVHRAKLFAAFPENKKEKIDTKWKSKFLMDRASRASANWDVIISPVEARVRSMEYRLPYKF